MYKKIIVPALFVFAAIAYWLLAVNEAPQPDEGVNAGAHQVKWLNKLPNMKYSKTGNPTLSDGDSMKFGNKNNSARMFGTDSPELAQKCSRNGQQWKCGQAAKQALSQKINNRKITCLGDEQDRYGRLIATCYVHVKRGQQQGFENLNQWMVKNGWSTAYRYYSKRYVKQEKYAQDNNLGIWQSEFMEPYKWRQQQGRN